MQFTTNYGLFIGKNLITLKEVDSTNSYARELLANSGPVPDGTVIMAVTQTGGRGQAGSAWLSEPGKNLTFSMILHCGFLPPPDQFYLSIAVSLGVVDVLKPELGGRASIKWPNDIYSGNQKLGGILIENILSGNRLKSSVIGIGLNVNQLSFPNLGRAVSMRQLKNAVFDLELLLGKLCHSVEIRYLQLKAGHWDRLRHDYHDDLLGYGAPARYSADSEEFEGTIRGVTREGKLLVESAKGTGTYDKKQIRFIF